MRFLLLAAWFATLAAAFLMGRTTGDTTEVSREPPRAESPEEGVPEPATDRGAGEGPSPADDAADSVEPDAPDEVPVPSPDLDSPEDPSPPVGEGAILEFEKARGFRQISRWMMAYVEDQLERGPEGYLAVVKSLDRLIKSKALRRVDEHMAVRELYPWLKFLVDHESGMVDMMEFLYKTMAEDPSAFEGMERNTLGVFTDALAVALPGVVSEERLARFREYALKILQIPESELPEAVRKNRRNIVQALDMIWSEPLTREQALERLQSAELTPSQALSLLAAADPTEFARAELTQLVGTALSGGRYDGVQFLRSLPPGSLDEAALDRLMVESLKKGRGSAWMLREYFTALGRSEWVQIRPFFDLALSTAPETAESIARLAAYLPGTMRADETYVRDLLLRYELSEQTAQRLRQAYDIR